MIAHFPAPTKPCAHCGGESRTVRTFDKSYYGWCATCGIRTQTYPTNQAAIVAWDTRAA